MLGHDFFKREHTKPLFNSNGILTVHNLHSYHSLLRGGGGGGGGGGGVRFRPITLEKRISS